MIWKLQGAGGISSSGSRSSGSGAGGGSAVTTAPQPGHHTDRRPREVFHLAEAVLDDPQIIIAQLAPGYEQDPRGRGHRSLDGVVDLGAAPLPDRRRVSRHPVPHESVEHAGRDPPISGFE